jgi:hypothetical protein
MIWDSAEMQTEVQLEVILVDSRQIHRQMFVTYEGLKLLHEIPTHLSVHGT